MSKDRSIENGLMFSNLPIECQGRLGSLLVSKDNPDPVINSESIDKEEVERRCEHGVAGQDYSCPHRNGEKCCCLHLDTLNKALEKEEQKPTDSGEGKPFEAIYRG